MPLLLAYDTTLEEKEGGQPVFDYTVDGTEIGPKFLGLGIERSNMQVCAVQALKHVKSDQDSKYCICQ